MTAEQEELAQLNGASEDKDIKPSSLVLLRTGLLKQIEDLNTKLGFTGCNGEMHMNEYELQEIIERKTNELASR